jgi:hypothetical protein
MVNRQEPPQPCPSNKLSKLTLATFDEDGMFTLLFLCGLLLLGRIGTV